MLCLLNASVRPEHEKNSSEFPRNAHEELPVGQGSNRAREILPRIRNMESQSVKGLEWPLRVIQSRFTEPEFLLGKALFALQMGRHTLPQRMSKGTSLLRPKFSVALQQSLRSCVFVAFRDTRARNIPALLSGVRVSLQSWLWEKSPFLFKARHKDTFVSCVTFQRKKKKSCTPEAPVSMVETGVSSVPAVKCHKVPPVWVWQCHSQAPLSGEITPLTRLGTSSLHGTRKNWGQIEETTSCPNTNSLCSWLPYFK